MLFIETTIAASAQLSYDGEEGESSLCLSDPCWTLSQETPDFLSDVRCELRRVEVAFLERLESEQAPF